VSRRRETELYAPVKAFLESQGYEVKAEVDGADVVARRGKEPPLVVELKTGFSLDLVLQGIRRQGAADLVYLAVPSVRQSGKRRRDLLGLCRRLGLGLIAVHLDRPTAAQVEVLLDPETYRPRPRPKARARLLREFQRRVGDPNTGGATRRPIVTAYRQDALRLALLLRRRGPSKAATVGAEAGVAAAGRMLRTDHYGWFERIARGVYRLTPKGEAALDLYADTLAGLEA